jgi:hypothetical protein
MPELSDDAPETTIEAPPMDFTNRAGTESKTEPDPDADAEAPKRKRRSSSKKQAEPRQPMTPEARAKAAKALTLGFLAAFNLAARARGEHWKLDTVEASELGGAWAEALEPWLPAIAGAAPWAAAIVVTYTVVEPRLTRDSEIAEARKVSETQEAEQVTIARGNNASA